MLRAYYNNHGIGPSATVPTEEAVPMIPIQEAELSDISVNDLQFIAEAPMEEDQFCNYLGNYITDLEAILIKIEAIKKSEKAIKKRLTASIKLYNQLVDTYYDVGQSVIPPEAVREERLAAPSTIMKAAQALDDLATKALEEKVTALDDFQ
jgi:hypothetical protein